MTCSRRLFFVAFAAALPLCAAGCAGAGESFGPFMSKGLQASGAWTGRLTSVKVHDLRGEQQFEAVALVIEAGPQTLRGTYAEPKTIDVGDAPYLSWQRVLIVSPEDMDIPLGSRVRESGKMIAHSAGARVPSQGGGTEYRPLRRDPGEASGDLLVIQMRGKPEVLKEE
jgi:hypothetical protein